LGAMATPLQDTGLRQSGLSGQGRLDNTTAILYLNSGGNLPPNNCCDTGNNHAI